MNTAFSQFARISIVLLMLFMQSATVVHAVEHTEAEHTEHCAVFITADQASDCDSKLVSIANVNIVDDWFQLSCIHNIQVARLKQLSRAPPFKRIV